jgi:CRISPR-associated protein Cmr2
LIRDAAAALAQRAEPTETIGFAARYHYLAATQSTGKAANVVRTSWAKAKQLRLDDDALFALLSRPAVDLAQLPQYSYLIQFDFTWEQPYASRDEQDFHIIDNPIRCDRALGLPVVAPSSWKGSLRAALRALVAEDGGGGRAVDEAVQTACLFGCEGDANGEGARAGRLHFFPTLFRESSLEIINPHDRERRVGTNPIYIECVPTGAKGTFTLLYVPFDLIAKPPRPTAEEVAHDLRTTAAALKSMLRVHGVGAKTSSGFGVAEEDLTGGTLTVRAELATQAAPAQPTQEPFPQPLAGYLETPDRLKARYLNADGSFRERSSSEIDVMNKRDQQQYEKANRWYHSHVIAQRKEDADVGRHPEPVATPPTSGRPFASFEELIGVAQVLADELGHVDEE